MSQSDQSAASDGANSSASPEAKPAAWQPLNAKQRRILGTLVEKAKTTPDAYPMTIAGLTTGCNQKSNRDPQMNLTQDQVEEQVDQLRLTGAITRVEGAGRVAKVRHYAYPWFGITGAEAAIMTELLLRGPQTLGELRQRASRMDPIPDLGSLQVLLSSLEKKNLIVYLTPAGRGQIVTHNVYLAHELDALRTEYANYKGHADDADTSPSIATSSATPHRSSTHQTTGLENKVAELEAQVNDLRQRIEQIEKLLK
jgi:uncharacterized protein YceH (UPF0502 family)